MAGKLKEILTPASTLALSEKEERIKKRMMTLMPKGARERASHTNWEEN